MRTLEQALLAPIVFFDLFDRPMRLEEVRRLAYDRALTSEEAIAGVATLVASGKLVQQGDWVALASRPTLFEQWPARSDQNRLLWAEAQAVISCLASVPFVRMVAVINSLALSTARATSDIDLLVVTDPYMLPVARDHMLIRLTALGRRAYNSPKQGKVFPDIWLTSDRLELASWRLSPHDMYFDYWLAALTPVIDRSQTYRQLIAANPWLRSTFPNWEAQESKLITTEPQREQHREWYERFYREPVGQWLAGFEGEWYHRRIHTYQEKLGPQALIVTTPTQLRIHEPDRRAEYQAQFLKRWHTVTQSPW